MTSLLHELADVTDADLLARHVAGDEQAFEVLFTRHRDRLWAVALRTMRNPDEAADALQEAMISAFRRADSFRGQAAVTTWLHRIVVNACLDRMRRNKVRATQPMPDNPDHDPTLAVAGDLQEEFSDKETAADVARALASINADQRAALVLVDMQGYSVDEAAALLGCAPGTVKSRCSRGRARLAPLLAHLREDG
ncbi:RNA polymerase sigma factor SigM [Aestuariimicrobium kwangyangense]|uniref:RNA polymerase sigma factor SigM n=1 Tax=Aestuariimicrobium kwangyangense TaxID=396389 RepID=UPI0003B65B1B|nr:RNA polymerase sigma factor SigM [Aestuariimicrobium kwangyangense]